VHFAELSALTTLITFNNSSGFGHNLALAALAAGDKVIATTRPQSLTKLDELKSRGANVLGLDVTAPLEELHEIAKEAVKVHGRIDVLVNNAGELRRLTANFVDVDLLFVNKGTSKSVRSRKSRKFCRI
jgi:NAD(P)-dependent dehydrogenase (short-subunit alcohol dehydrogenase family)